MPDITQSRWPIHVQNSELFNKADVLNKRRDIVKTNVEFYEDVRTGKTEERVYYLLKLKDGSTRRYSTWEEVAYMIKQMQLLDTILRSILAEYKKQNPMRTADCHNPECCCQRCLMDKIDGYLQTKK